PFKRQCEADERELKKIFIGAAIQGGDFILTDNYLLRCFGYSSPVTLHTLWQSIGSKLIADGYQVCEFAEAVDVILQNGSLAKRVLKNIGLEPERSKIVSVWSELAGCLNEGRLYG
ncbi:MAG: hypothetical protein NTX25_17655, partial [Proteobacteria bacterium]|nr:hypothetical protein [Pseudomonadota bacterium]